jgi:hypothetical protein
MEILNRCCGERTCQRNQPVRIRREDDGHWYALTQYSETAGEVREVFQRHRLAKRDEQALERGWQNMMEVEA